MDTDTKLEHFIDKVMLVFLLVWAAFVMLLTVAFCLMFAIYLPWIFIPTVLIAGAIFAVGYPFYKKWDDNERL